MDWKSYIVLDEKVLVGKPCIIGTRISVEHILNLFASGWDESQILENYPRLSRVHLQAVFAYLNEIIKDDFIYNKSFEIA